MALSANAGPGPDPAGGEERLPCGRALREVWDAWDADRATGDPHYAACPHCTAALHGLRTLDDFVRSARSEEEAQRRAEAEADGGRAAEAVTARVMDIVRRELRPGRSLPLGEPDEDAWIVEAAAARTFRSAVDAVPGVRAGSCRIVPEPDGRAVRVRVEVAVGLTRGVPQLADEVRDRITAAARDAVGLRVAAVDVAVVDLLPDDDAHDGEYEGEARP